MLLITGFHLIAFSQQSASCLSESIVFSRQGKIDSFSIAHHGCTSIIGNVKISGPAITNLSGLKNIKTIGGNFTIENNINLTSFGTLALDSIMGNLIISFNANLVDCSGLDELLYIKGDFHISRNATMEDLAGLDALQVIGGDLNISYNIALKNISGMTSLVVIHGDFKLSGNNALKRMLGLQSLEGIAGNVLLDVNYSLPNISELKRLKTIGGKMTVVGNSALIDFTGLHALTFLGGDLSISNNIELTSLDGLDSLHILQGALLIFNNSKLTDLRGLDHVNQDTLQNVVIENSIALSDCATQSICKYLASNKPAQISNNAFGCNSMEEVFNACQFSANDSRNENNIILYPDPASGIIYIKGNTSGIVSITITSIQGHHQKNWGHPKKLLDLSELPDGLYILKIKMKGTVQVKRIVKEQSKITIHS